MFGDPTTNTKELPIANLPELGENLDNKRIPITGGDRKAGKYPYYGASGIVDYVADYIFDDDLLLISEDGANLVARVTPIAFPSTGKVWINNHAHVIKFKSMAMQCYVENLLNMIDISPYVTGTAQPKLNQAKLNTIPIPVPEEDMIHEYLAFVHQSDKSKFISFKSLFMHGTMISDLINISGDVHHIFPKAYLKKNGVDSKGRYNQVANFTYLDTQVNKAVKDDAPNIYFGKVIEQCENNSIAFGNIADRDSLMRNLDENAIPQDVIGMTVDDYDTFLVERRKLMAKLVEKYYKGL